jgi:hypothetical protein
MLENKWNNIAPEVPQDFHEKFEETLRHIEQADAVMGAASDEIMGMLIAEGKDCSSSNLYWYGCYCGCKRVL